MYYPVTISWFLRKVVYPQYLWGMPVTDKSVYLSFDDGPHPEITPFVLEELRKAGAEASFFCIGKNVAAHQRVYAQVLQEGHAAGNHSYHHLNGWKTPQDVYVKDIALAQQQMDTKLYRPPYGKITRGAARRVQQELGLRVVMWSVLSGDFDRALSPEACLRNVISNVKPGSIVVFHDSEKAFERLRYALPRVVDYFGGMGYVFKKISV